MTGRAVYVSWGAHRRADEIARGMSADLVVFKWHTTDWVRTPIRYAVQFVQTILILLRRRPKAVISHHTQPFCSLACLLYCTLFRARLVTDCHDGAFIDRRWQRFPLGGLNRVIFARARMNLVHHSLIRDHVVDVMGISGRFEVLRNGVPEMPCGAAAEDRAGGRIAVAVVCSFGADEPVDVIMAAAREVPEAQFEVTGNPSRLPRAIRDEAPANVAFTGFLPDDEYDELLCTATVALVLSTRENVLTQGCHEVMGAGRPLVTSMSEAAQRYLTRGTVLVANTAEDVAAGLRSAIARSEELAREMKDLADERRTQWETRVAELRVQV